MNVELSLTDIHLLQRIADNQEGVWTPLHSLPVLVETIYRNYVCQTNYKSLYMIQS